MPELPEVETARRLLERVLVGRTIAKAQTAPDPVVYDRASPSEVRSALLDRTVTAARRKGKYLWLVLDEPPHPVFHFGMSGHVVLFRGDGDPPPYWKLIISGGWGLAVAIADVRRLGRIRLAMDPDREPPISSLGFDALTELPSTARLHGVLASRGSPIKAVLLDQGFAAGVGNWVADEVLYQARLSPLRPANSLTTPEVRAMRAALKKVLHRAVAVDADAERFPRSWLFHRRWDHRIGASALGEPLVRQKIGGRTTTWAPTRQH